MNRGPGDVPGPDRPAILLLAFAAAILFARFWEADLYDDPLLYAGVAREMVRSGDWWTPHWGPDPYFKKPPLIFWLTALNFTLFGVSRATAMFWSAALAAASVPLTYCLARRWFGEWAAIWAGIILATTPRFVKDSISLRLDSPLTFFVLAAVWAAVAASAGRPRLHLVAGACAALAILTKGPFGLLALTPYALRPAAGWWRHRHAWAGVALALLLPGLWYGSMILLHGPVFARTAFVSEGVGRVVQNLGDSDRWAYLRMMAQYYWPWLPFLVAGGWMYGLQLRREGLRWEGAFPALLAGALGSVLILVQTRYYRYVQPLYPFLAMVAALPCARLLAERRRRWVLRAVGGAAVAISVLTSVLPVRLHRSRNAGIEAAARDLARTPGAEVAVSPEAADHNILSALWFHGGFLPREWKPHFFQAAPPQGRCFRLLYRPEEREGLAEDLTLTPERSLRNDRTDYVLATACRRRG